MKCYFFTKLSRIRHDGSEFRLVMILAMQGVSSCRSQSYPSFRSCDVIIGGSTTTTCTGCDKCEVPELYLIVNKKKVEKKYKKLSMIRRIMHDRRKRAHMSPDFDP